MAVGTQPIKMPIETPFKSPIKVPQIPPSSSGHPWLTGVNRPWRSMVEVPASPYPMISDRDSTFQIDGTSLDRLSRFQMRTVLTLGNPIMAQTFQKETTRLACTVSAHVG